MGRRETLVLDLAHVQRVLDEPATGDMRRYGWRSATTVASLLVGDKGAIAGWLAGETTVNSVDRPILEFYSLGSSSEPGPLRASRNVGALARVMQSASTDVQVVHGDDHLLSRARGAVASLLAGLAVMTTDLPLAAVRLEMAAAADPEQEVVRRTAAESLEEVGRGLDLLGRDPEALGWYGRALRIWPAFP